MSFLTCEGVKRTLFVRKEGYSLDYGRDACEGDLPTVISWNTNGVKDRHRVLITEVDLVFVGCERGFNPCPLTVGTVFVDCTEAFGTRARKRL